MTLEMGVSERDGTMFRGQGLKWDLFGAEQVFCDDITNAQQLKKDPTR